MFSNNIKCPHCKFDFYESDWDDELKTTLEVGEFKLVSCPNCKDLFEAKLKYFASGSIGLRYFKSFKNIVIKKDSLSKSYHERVSI